MSDDKKLDYYLAAWDLLNPKFLTQTMTSHIYTVTHDTRTVILKLLSPSEMDEQRGAVALRYFDGHGAVRLLRYSFLLEVARLTGVLLVPSVPTLVLMRVVGGISFSWYVVAVFSFISEAAPERQVTTTLALFNVTLASFIRMIAAPISGFIFDQVGGYYLYALGVIGSVVAWAIMKTMHATRDA